MKGTLVRGAVTFGDVFVVKDQVFGPGLVEAYDLESQWARYPRIVVSPRLLNEIDTNPLYKGAQNTASQEQTHVRRLLRCGDDGIWFIDYLRAIEEELDDPYDYVELLQAHRTLVVAGCEKHEPLSSVGFKYSWLGQYHNSVVANLHDRLLRIHGTSRARLRIELR